MLVEQELKQTILKCLAIMISSYYHTKLISQSTIYT